MRTVLRPSLLALLGLAACHASVHTGSTCGADSTGSPLSAETTTPVSYGPTPFDQTQPAAASNGKGYLAAWTQELPPASSVIAAMAIGADGAVPSGASTVLPTSGGGYDQAALVTATPNGYFVAWVHSATSSAYGELAAKTEIRGARLDPNGHLLDNVPMIISPASDGVTQGNLTLASNGGSALLAWSSLSADGVAVQSSVIAAEGDATAPRTAFTSASGSWLATPAVVAAADDGFFLAWDAPAAGGGVEIQAVDVLASGQAILAPLTLREHGRTPALATNGTSIFMTWIEEDPYGEDFDRETSLVAGNGATSPTELGSYLFDDGTSIVWDGTDFVMSTANDTMVFDANGVQTDTTLSPSTDGAPFALASDGTSLLMLGSDVTYRFGFAITGALYAPGGGDALATFQPARSLAAQSAIAVATGGGQLFAAWLEATGPDPTAPALAGAFFGRDGKLEGNPFVLRESSVKAGAPSVTYDGADFVVAWSEESGLTWTHIQPGQTTLGDVQSLPIVAGNELMTGGGHIVLTTMDGGFFLDQSVDTSKPPFQFGTPAGVPVVAWDGTRYVAAWSSKTELLVESFDPLGKPSDAQPTIVYNPDALTTGISVASDGHGSDLVSYVTNSGTPRLWLSSVTGGVVATMPAELTPKPDESLEQVTVAFNGTSWLVGYGASTPDAAPVALAHVSLSKDGMTVTARDAIAPNGAGIQLASDGAGTTFIAYETVDSTATIPRVAVRVLDETTPVAPASPSNGAAPNNASSSSSSGSCR